MKYIALAFGLFAPQGLFAHGIGQRIDLPIPLDIYLGAAAVVLVLSFVLIGVLGKRARTYETSPRFNVYSWGWLRSICESNYFIVFLKTLSVVFLGILLYAGFWGDQTPTDNILPVFVWVGFTVALTYIVAFVGNIWLILNPWKALHELLDPKERFSKHVSWPRTFGVWPAFALFVVFRFLENIYVEATNPQILATLVSVYSIITLLGAFLFGREQWFKNGDPFSVFYRFLSTFAVFSYETYKDTKALVARPPAFGLLKKEPVSFSEMMFVLLMLATVSFDGISSTAFAASILTFLLDSGITLVFAKTILMFGVFAVFVLIYLLFTVLIRNYAQSQKSVLALAKQFVLSLLPIAIVYEVAHFALLLLTEGQRISIRLSDPFGYGWDLFGTASQTVNYGFVNFKLLWNVEIALIMLGHIASIYIAHMVALNIFNDVRTARRSQIPMLILMIGYTVLGLWILAQPPVLVG